MLLPVLFGTLLFLPRPVTGQTLDDSFRSDIEKLLEVTGTSQMGTQITQLISSQFVAGLKKSQPSIPDRALELAKQVLDAEMAKAFAGPDDLTQQLVDIYAKYYTHEDVRGLLAFLPHRSGKESDSTYAGGASGKCCGRARMGGEANASDCRDSGLSASS